LSGKPFYEHFKHMVTSPKIEAEFNPGGRDYAVFQYLKERGLQIMVPSRRSEEIIENIAFGNGESDRLSGADKELLALALDLKQQGKNPILISDDYAMQNLAAILTLRCQSISQHGITNKFKWERRCRGCGRQVEPQMTQCPICGSSVVHVVKKKSRMKKPEM
jgi:UPF0271 protein